MKRIGRLKDAATEQPHDADLENGKPPVLAVPAVLAVLAVPAVSTVHGDLFLNSTVVHISIQSTI